MEPIRAFIAIELPSQIKAALSELQDNLKTGKSASVKWVGPEGIHLTLKFLGNVDEAEIPALNKALSEAVRGVAPFYLELGEPGAFPSSQAPRVVWVGVGGEIEPLRTLHNNIDRVLDSSGVSPGKAGFLASSHSGKGSGRGFTWREATSGRKCCCAEDRGEVIF